MASNGSPPVIEGGLGDDEHEVTRFNYEDGLKEIIALVELADFVAIDATVETTGVLLMNEAFNPELAGEDGKKLQDPWGEWYDNIKTQEKTWILLEVGIALFKRVPGNPNKLECDVFNIPVLPAITDDNEMARFHGSHVCNRLKINGYGMQFISAVKFDVNKPFYMGAPYLNKELLKAADKYMVENPGFMVAARKRRLSMELMPRLVDYVSPNDRVEILNRLKGVAHVFETISELRKPVIGHHLFFKLMFIYKDFFEFLPDTYTLYYDKIREKFPIIYDTKFMADKIRDLMTFGNRDVDRVTGKTLYELFRNINRGFHLEKNPNTFNVEFWSRSDQYLQDVIDLLHGDEVEKDLSSYCYVAGFDALISGLLFLDLVKTVDFAKIEVWPMQEMSPTPTDGTTESTGARGIECKSYKDCLDMFIKGQPTRLVNCIYQECPVSDKRTDKDTYTNEETLNKKKMWYKKRQAERMDKRLRNRSLVFLASSGVGLQFTP